MAQLIKPMYKPMRKLGLFKKYFAAQTNDFSVAGSRLMNDGSGEVNFRAALFLDHMNGASINTRYWKIAETGTMNADANVGKGIKFYWAGGGSVGDYAYIRLKGSYGRINETGAISFILGVKGIANGGTGMLHDDTSSTEQMLFGMYCDDDNYVCIRDDSGLLASYVLITKFNGNETVSTAFTIPSESTADQKIEIIMNLDNAEVYLDNVLKTSNSTNIPNNAELRPFLRLKHATGQTGDNFIYADYIRVEQ